MAGDKSLGNRMNSATKVPFGDRTNCEPNGDEEDAKAAKKREQARERTRRWLIMASIDSEVSTQLPMSVLTENQVCVTPIIGLLKRKIEHHHSFLEDSSNRPGKFASGGAVVVDGSNCPVFGDD
ncbi:hypothetical protein EJB05_23120 [Eragrostis curvula]|uniref:Uncharacterized protein n=1 Tax=Eragrostis curvula TaxID=38414 RepID=A0A5J9V684_9POAL|nr:hypothetical protein EJB05_23120 [Eragrostis curvula]